MPATPFHRLRPGLLLACGLLVGLAVGWFGGRRHPDAAAVQAYIRTHGEAAPVATTPLTPADASFARGRNGETPAVFPRIAPSADLRADLRTLVAIADPLARLHAMRTWFAELPPDRWTEVFAALEKMDDDDEFDDNANGILVAFGTFDTVLHEIAQRDARGFLSGLVDRGQVSEQDDAFEAVFHSWAARDLAAARAFFTENSSRFPAGELRTTASHLAREFVKRDAPGTFDWIKTLPADVQGGAARDAFQTLSHVDSVLAAEMLVTHEEIPDRGDVAGAIGEGWAKTEPAKALEWAQKLPAELSGEALGRIARVWAQQDYATAAARAWELDSAGRTAFLPHLASSAPPDELPGLAARLSAEPDGATLPDALSTAAQRWAEKDPTAASQWLATEPAGPRRDAAIAGFAAEMHGSDPASAFEWLAVMSDATKRAETLDTGVKEWAGRDPVAARAWVQSSPRLTPADRERLLERTGR